MPTGRLCKANGCRPQKDHYPEFLDALADQVDWLRMQGKELRMRVWIGIPGLIVRQTGDMLSANFCANEHALPDDLGRRAKGVLPDEETVERILEILKNHHEY
jgi:hypothetical protein